MASALVPTEPQRDSLAFELHSPDIPLPPDVAEYVHDKLSAKLDKFGRRVHGRRRPHQGHQRRQRRDRQGLPHGGTAGRSGTSQRRGAPRGSAGRHRPSRDHAWPRRFTATSKRAQELQHERAAAQGSASGASSRACTSQNKSVDRGPSDRTGGGLVRVGPYILQGRRKSRPLTQGGSPVRIAQVAPLYESVPPQAVRRHRAGRLLPHRGAGAAGPRGHAVRQRRLGHHRQLVPSAHGSLRLDRRLRRPRSPTTCCMLEQVLRAAPTSSTSSTSTSTTCTSRCRARIDVAARDDAARPARPARPARRCTASSATMPLVSISDAQRAPLPWANWQATVYHGLPPDLLHASRREPGDYLAFLGRISPEKRVGPRHRDRRAASGMPLQDRRQGRPRRPATTSSSRSSRCSTTPLRRVHRRDRRASEKDEFLGDAARCCSRSTGPSRSAW